MAAVPSIGRASLVEAPRVAPQAAATEGLYERHAAKIQSYCHHQLGSREEAEDAVQTTFMNAFRALGRGVVPEAESAWLFKIAENVCLSRRRSSWRRGKIESPSDFGVIEEIVPGPSLQRDELIGIEDALASMPEQQRRAILLREWQGLSYREIATELEVSQSAVETLIFRARRSLAQGLEQPDSIKPKRKSFRRALHMVDFGTIAAALKTLLAGGAALKATAAAVAVTAAVGTAATVAPELKLKAPKRQAVALAAPAASTRSAPSAPAAVLAAPSPRVERVAVTPAPVFRPVKQKAAHAEVGHSAPARALARPVASEPAQVAPVEQQPSAEAAPAPVVEEPKHEKTPPASEPARREPAGKSGEGKKDEGKHEGKARPESPGAAAAAVTTAEPVVSAPAERRHGNSKNHGGDGKAKESPTVAQAPAPEAVTAAAPAPVEVATDQSSKKERGRGGHAKRELTAVPAVLTAAAPVATAAATTAAPTADPAVATLPVAESSDSGWGGKGDGHGKRKGK
ncbi:MAG TPA: sigma-70 family RNA polymerase sigma factor [Gaiellaceae bacterium]|nr:sigma-70 family RNA polymerase sigma factor [Gaiellaceae bacterium]